jgi:hypothetical protein
MEAAFWRALRVTFARIDDASFDEVFVRAGRHVVTVVALALLDFGHDRARLRRLRWLAS